jgi:hypothetical protein
MTEQAFKGVEAETLVHNDKAATYPVVFFDYKKSTLGHLEELTWEEFCNRIRHKQCDDKEQAGLFAGALLKEDHHPRTGEIGHRRCKEHVERRSLVILDIDCKESHALKAPQALEIVDRLKHHWKGQWAFYTSHSHTPQAPRYRIVFPIDATLNLPNDFFPATYIADRLGLLAWLDKTKLLVNSLFYWPSHPPGRQSSKFGAVAREGGTLGADFFAEYLEQYEREEADRRKQEEAASAAAEAARQERIAKGGDGTTLIEKARSLVPSVPELLAKHGYTLHGRKWLHPESKSGTPGVSILKGRDGIERAYSHNWTDEIHTFRGGNHALDNLDLLCLFELGSNEDELYRYLSEIAPKSERFHSSHADLGIDDLDEVIRSARREQQKKENEEIGDALPEISILPAILTVEQMLDRFALLTDGSQVIDLLEPRRCYALPDFVNAFRASRFSEEIEAKDGKKKTKETPVTSIWINHAQRKMLESKTFHPGAPLITKDPEGRDCVNTWIPFVRLPKSAAYETHTTIFTEHIDYLFGQEAPRFLDWLAHIEKQPGVLPHTAWLHISTETGTGRNAMSGILSRIWAGRVAPSFDLVSTLTKGFNGRISGKILAIVDELREGGSEGRWELTERLKSFLTEEHRAINPKYGRQYVEHNCSRLLMFSNHLAAIPIDEKDRRIEVVVMQDRPQDGAYYKRLYGVMNRVAFINDLALFLGERDLSGFEPGARARQSEAKSRVAMQSESEPKEYARALADQWPADVVPSRIFHLTLDPDGQGRQPRSAKAIASELGFVPLGRAIKVGGKAMRVIAVRNADLWAAAAGINICLEVQKGPYEHNDPRSYIDSLSASADGPMEF